MAALAFAVAIVTVSAGVAGAEPPIVRPPHQPPIAGSFHVSPDAGPVGSTITYHGFCGFPNAQILPGILMPDNETLVHLFDFAGTTGPWGQFSVAETIPAVGNQSDQPVAPGGYLAAVSCADEEHGIRLPNQLLEIAASKQRGGAPSR